RPESFASRRRPKARPASPCVPPSWPCCWTASIGKTPSGRSATTDRRRRRGEWTGWAGGWRRPLFSCPPRNKSGPQYVIIGMSLADPAAGLPPTTAEHLPDGVAPLRRMGRERLASLHRRDRAMEALRPRLDLLLRRLYGPRGERFDPNQPLLFAELTASQDAATAALTEPAA